ncbi:histone-lysine N-methyltransferase PRDM6, partial [Paramuricea clavata]
TNLTVVNSKLNKMESTLTTLATSTLKLAEAATKLDAFKSNMSAEVCNRLDGFTAKLNRLELSRLESDQQRGLINGGCYENVFNCLNEWKRLAPVPSAGGINAHNKPLKTVTRLRWVIADLVKICGGHLRLHAEDHGKGGSIKATYAVMSFPDEVQLCTSSIPGYIYGACARRHLPSGTWIGPYEGQRTFDQRNGSCENQDYLWEIYTEGNFSHFIDGSDENSSSWMRFIRCARNRKEQNMAAYQCGQNIYYRSFCEIGVGEELLVWYSDSYLKHLEIPLSLKETDQLKIEELVGNFNEKGPTVSLAAPTPQALDRTSSIPVSPRPFPPETATSQGYPEYHTTTSHETSFLETESAALPRSSEPVTPTVQQALADQVKKRIEKGKYLQSQELPKIEENEEKYVFNEFPKAERSDFQDQVNWSDFQHQAKTSDFQHQNAGNYEREGHKAAVLNDLCLPFKCRQCLKVFTQRIQLQMHVCPKEPYKPFQCGHCSLSFAQPLELRNHVVVHSSERPFKCGFCGRSFAGATTLNNHVRTHTGERPFVCKSCGKTFAIATQLARHTRVLGECPGHVSSTHGAKYASESFVGND